MIIAVWVPAIIPECCYPGRYPGLFQLFLTMSRKLLSELHSDSNQLLSDCDFHLGNFGLQLCFGRRRKRLYKNGAPWN